MPPLLRGLASSSSTPSGGSSPESSAPNTSRHSESMLHTHATPSAAYVIRRPRYMIWTVAAVATVLVLFLQTRVTSDQMPISAAAEKHSRYPAPTLTGSVTAPGVGFVFVAMGSYARQLKCEAAIETLRKNAGWEGPIYLITDAPQCFDHNRWGGCDLDATIVPVSGVDLADGFTMPVIGKAGTKGNRLLSKSYKMRIFELIPDPAIEILIFMDCDILSANAPNGCLSEFISQYANPEAFNETTSIYIYPENNPTKINGIVHSGSFVVHRHHSADILKRWMEQLLTEEDSSDQAAFIRAGIDSYVFIDEPKYLYRPRCDRDDCSTRTDLMKCFNHLNYARCINQGTAAIQNLVDRWDLCTMQGVKYCHPIYMEPFAKTWLPYRSCKKMEFGAFG